MELQRKITEALAIHSRKIQFLYGQRFPHQLILNRSPPPPPPPPPTSTKPPLTCLLGTPWTWTSLATGPWPEGTCMPDRWQRQNRCAGNTARDPKTLIKVRAAENQQDEKIVTLGLCNSWWYLGVPWPSTSRERPAVSSVGVSPVRLLYKWLGSSGHSNSQARMGLDLWPLGPEGNVGPGWMWLSLEALPGIRYTAKQQETSYLN